MKKTMPWKKNNEGSSMVLVVVAAALVSILVATMMATTFTNYQMKQQERMEKTSFYSAEGALEEIKAGMQKQVSIAFEDAYTQIMEQYAVTPEKQDIFEDIYLGLLHDVYYGTTGMGSVQYYNCDLLESYCEKSRVMDNSTSPATFEYGAEIPDVEPGAVNEYQLVETTEGLLFKNLVIKYTDEKGNVSMLKTDILLAYPDINLNSPSEMPNLPSYALVANKNFNIYDHQSMTIDGNVYAGNEQLKLGLNSTIDISAVDTLIANNILIDKMANLQNISGNNNVWANNINVDGGDLTLSGNTYVANDLSINGVDSEVSLSGNYQGFGTVDAALLSDYYKLLIGEGRMTPDNITSHKADYSSAIVVNGKNTNLDLSGLTRLSLADNAYVSAFTEGAAGGTGFSNITGYTPDVDVKMGESITVKSNQLAYLVPAELVGVGKKHGGINPMTATTYQNLVAEYAGQDLNLVDMNTPIPGIGISLNMLKTAENPVQVTGAKTVFYPVGNTSVVYLFLEFADTESANNYFKWYYGANKDELDDYLNIYNNTIQFNQDGSATVDLSGNVMVGDAVGGYSYQNDTIEGSTDNSLQLAKQLDIYAAMQKKMVSNFSKLSKEEKLADVYTNLVNVQAVDNVGVSSSGVLTFELDDPTEGMIRGIVADQNYELDIDAIPKGFLIVDGNVTVKGSGTFYGLIIASGDIIVEQGCIINSHPNNFKKIIRHEKNGDCMMNYLINGQDYLTGGTAGSNTSVGAIDLSSLVETRNWEKQ